MATTPATATTLASDVSEWRHFDYTPGETYGERVGVGLIALANDRASEPELKTFLPQEGVALWASRVPMSIDVSLDALAGMANHLDACVRLLMPDDRLDVLAYGCTSGTMTIGPERVAELVHSARPGVPVTDPISSSLDGLRLLGAKRIALLTPYIDEVNHFVEGYVTQRGFEIPVKGAFHARGDPEIGRIPAEAILDAGRQLGANDVDALFISCTGLRAASVIAPLEAAIGKPVVTSNQALAWSCLRIAGWDRPVEGYGRLLTLLGG